MRIAIVADDLYPGFGGQAAATEGHIEALLARGHELRALAGNEPNPTEAPHGVEVQRVGSWQPGRKQTRFALIDRSKLSALLSWADVVQCNTPTLLTALALRMARERRIPSVVGIHSQEESTTYHAGSFKPVAALALRSWYRYLYRRADSLTAPTQFAAHLARAYTDIPIFVVSNGIRFPELPNDAARRAARARYLGGNTRYLAVYVGRLAEEKKPERLLELFAKVCAHSDEVRLAIAGGGPLGSRLEQQASELGLRHRLDFLGYVSEEEKSDLLWAADLFIMPSPTELQSIATLEAMARRCAVVTVDDPTSAVGDIVRSADAGLVYQAAAPGPAAAAVLELLEDPARLGSLQDHARMFAAQHDIAESGRQLEEIYTMLRESRRNGAHMSAMGVQS